MMRKFLYSLGGIAGFVAFVSCMYVTLYYVLRDFSYVSNFLVAAEGIVGLVAMVAAASLYLYCSHKSRDSKNPNPRPLMRLLALGCIPTFLLFFVTAPSSIDTRRILNQVEVIATLRTIITAQYKFQSEIVRDADENGVGDFGSLEQLVAADTPYIDELSASRAMDNYVFTVEVRDGTKDVEPGFTVTAVPRTFGLTGDVSYFSDETGIIRFAIDETIPDTSSQELE